MDLYLLDDKYVRQEIIEGYESLIWTERYSEVGEIELVIDPSLVPTNMVAGSLLAMSESQRIMQVLTSEKKVDGEGADRLTFTGPEITDILKSRSNNNAFSTGAVVTLRSMNGTPSEICAGLFQSALRIPAITEDTLYGCVGTTLNSPGGLSLPGDVITVELGVASTYDSIKNLCDMYNMGFRIVHDKTEASPSLHFETYMGTNRTSGQSVVPAVVFSSALSNLSDTTELRSMANLKTVAYVVGDIRTAIVYAPGYDNTFTGINRRVLIVDATDIPNGTTAQLQQRGLEALAENRVIIGFDGQIPKDVSYIYGKDYFLGDIVEQQSESGVVETLRVTEQIFVSDSEGERSYPTLTVDSIITPGTWAAWGTDVAWPAIGEETWSEA